MKYTMLAIALIAAGCASTPPAEAPAGQPEQETLEEIAPPESNCPILDSEEVEIPLPTETGEPLIVNDLEHDRIWNNDLNGDGMPDMILQQRGACNAEDECVTSIWLGCTPQTFTQIWGPDFAYELYVLEESHTFNDEPWVTIELARAQAGGGDLERTTLHFDGSSYAPADK